MRKLTEPKIAFQTFRFPKTERETLFVQEYRRNVFLIIRFILALGILGNLMSIIVGDAQYVSGETLEFLRTFRFSIIIPFMGLGLIGTTLRRYRHLLYAYLGIGMLLTGVIFALILRKVPFEALLFYTSEYTLTLMALLLLSRFLFRHIILIFPLGVIITLGFNAYRQDLSWTMKVHVTFFTIVIMTYTLIASYLLERYARSNFLRIQLLAKQRKRLNILAHDLKEQAIRDDLTGLFNRRYMMVRLRETILNYKRYQQPTSLILLDLDNFKTINDQFGHSAGDAILQKFALHIVHQVRSTDLVFRFGGDEFLVLLPNTSLEKATQIGHRLTHGMQGFNIETSSQFIALGASAGVTTISDDTQSPEDLLHKVDHALYRAKWAGKGLMMWKA